VTDPLIVDCYEGDFERTKMDFMELAKAGAPWSGVLLKSSQGNYYNGGTWFAAQWRLVQLAGLQAWRQPNWIRGAYHYYDFAIDPVVQADYFVKNMGRAGGVLERDILMVDIERAGQRKTVTGSQVVNQVSEFVERVTKTTARWVMLYAGSWLSELGVTNRMGCRYLITARYTKTLPQTCYTRIGWDLASLAGWQYCGDGVGELPGYPTEAPGCGKVDITALVLPGGFAKLFSAPAVSV
jgi:GH25 family lysozyme M1 (1,4-beta-N-acetylmuramidase)